MMIAAATEATAAAFRPAHVKGLYMKTPPSARPQRVAAAPKAISPRTGEDPPGLLEMRPVIHPPADRQHARIALALERLHHRARIGDLGLRWREGGVDDRHLTGVNGQLGGEAVARRLLRLALQKRVVAEI